MNRNFKARLKNGDTMLGMVATLGTPEVTEILAKAGFDWLWVDMEHTSADLARVQAMLQAAGPDCPCLVRVPWNDDVWIKRVLELGGEGVIIPQIRSAEEAKAAIAACKYPPVGVRSVGIGRAQAYGMEFAEYIAEANDAITIALQIEHIQAVQNLPSILETPGIDAIIIGPYDLSASMGLMGQVTHPDVQEAMQKIKSECQARQIPLGIFVGDAASAKPHLESGCTLVALGVDAMYLWRAAKEALREIREI